MSPGVSVVNQYSLSSVGIHLTVVVAIGTVCASVTETTGLLRTIWILRLWKKKHNM